TALPDDLPTEADVVAAVTALLEPHPNGVTPLAEITASIEGTTVAVATGDDDDCVLMRRSEARGVHDVDISPIYLEPGALGWRGSTAFATLPPPHRSVAAATARPRGAAWPRDAGAQPAWRSMNSVSVSWPTKGSGASRVSCVATVSSSRIGSGSSL